MHTRIDVTPVTISATTGVTPDTEGKIIVLDKYLRILLLIGRLNQPITKGMGVILSETPIPFEDGVLTNELGGLVDAGPVNTKVGYNTLCLALDQLKRTDTGKFLRGEE